MVVRDLQADYHATDDKQFGFSVVASRLMPMKSLSDRDFRVLAVLLSFFDVYGETFISNDKLAEISGKSLSAVKRSLHNLVKNGFINTRVERKGKLITRRFISETPLLDKLRKESKSPNLYGGKSENELEPRCINGLENKNSINKNIEYIGEFSNVNIDNPNLNKLKERFGVDLTNRSVDKLSAYLRTSPIKARKYKDHYSVIISWVIKSVLENNPPLTLTQSQMAECEKKFSQIRGKYNYDQGSQKFRLK